MPLYPARVRWSQSVTAGSYYEFTVEISALANTKAIYRPLLFMYNMSSTASLDLKITHVMSLGPGDDPLGSGTFTQDMVDTAVPQESSYQYDFLGIHLSTDTSIAVTHVVRVTNNDAADQPVHLVLYGQTDLEAQLPAGNAIVRGTS